MDDFRVVLAKRFGVDLSNIEEVENEGITNTFVVQYEQYKKRTNLAPELPIKAYFLNLFGTPRVMIFRYEYKQNINNAPLLATTRSISISFCNEKQLSIPYWYATDDGFWGFFSEAGKSLKEGVFKSLDDVDLISLVESNKAIHDSCFGFLKKLYQMDNVLFTFRRDTKGLNQGFWFDGEVEGKSEESCILSFWEGYDSVANTPNIYIEILRSGTVRLVLSAKDNKLKQSFFEDFLIDYLKTYSFEQQLKNGKKEPIWFHTFTENWKEGYLKILDDFIERYPDKDVIDSCLKISLEKHKKNLGDLNFIDPKTFSEQFNRVLELKDRLELGEAISIDFVGLSEFDLKLKTLHLENIGHFKNFEIDLSKRVICLMGENGSGKTTILRALLLALTGVDQTIDLDKSKDSIKQLLRVEGINNGKIRYAKDGNIRIAYELDSKLYENNISFFKPESSGIIQLKDVYAKDKNSFVLTHQNYYSHLILGFPQLQTTEKARNEGLKESSVYDALPLIENEPIALFEGLKEWIIRLDGDNKPNNNAKKAKDWEEVYAKEADIIKLVFKVVSEITQADQKNIIEFDSVNHLDGILWVKIIDKKNPTEPQIVPFELISQGFKNVFAWVGHFIKRMVESNDGKLGFEGKYALVLVDEIDTYLHPKWQRYILNALAKHFKNTRFIVSTHSPLVVNYLKNVPKKDRVLYIIEKDQNEPREESFLYGRSLKAVFLDWIGVGEYADEIIHKTETIFSLIDSGAETDLKKAEKLIAELEMEPEDAIMVEMKSWLAMKWEDLLENQNSVD